jgi:four helix bundle protein
MQLSDAEGEAAESRVWIDFSYKCNYIPKSVYSDMYKRYDNVIGKLVNMSRTPEKWQF